MSEDFRRAIQDLDHEQAPGAFQDARAAILREIHHNPAADPQRIVQEINRVENAPGHAHHDVALMTQRGYLDIVPLQNPGYGQEYPQPGYGQQYPQPGYGQEYPQPGYGQGYPRPGYNQGNPAVPFVEGAIIGGVLGSILRHRH